MTASLRAVGRRAPRRWRSVVMAVLALASLAAAAAQEGYFPAQDGASWTYDSGESHVHTVVSDDNGVITLRRTHYIGGVPVSEELRTVSEGGVLLLGTAAGGRMVRYDPPLLAFAAPPLAPGDTWSTTTLADGQEITLSVEVLGMEGVATPAGRFNALRLRQTTVTSAGGRRQQELYFVPTVGIVRYVTADGTVVDLIDVTR